MGTVTATIQWVINPSVSAVLGQIIVYPSGVAYFFDMTPLLGGMMSLGTLVGDLGGAFIKRRLSLPRGAPAPLLDQLDFVIGMLLFTAFLHPLNLFHYALLVLVTPLIHFTTNFGGFLLKLKREPW